MFDTVLTTSTSFGGPGVDRLRKEGTWNWPAGTSNVPYIVGVAPLVIQANGGALAPDQVRAIFQAIDRRPRPARQ